MLVLSVKCLLVRRSYIQFFCPRRFAGWFAVKEEDVGFYALSVENARWQAQECVDVAFMEDFASYGFACSAFKEDIVGNDYGCFSVDF